MDLSLEDWQLRVCEECWRCQRRANRVSGGAVQQHISNICGDGNSYNRTIQHGSRVGGYRAAGRWLVSLRIGSFNFSSFSSIEEKKLAGQFKHKLFCSYFVQNFTFIIFSPNLKLHFKDHGFSLQISKMSLFTIYLP